MKISDLDLAAAIYVSTKRKPDFNDTPQGIRVFTFPDDEAVIAAVTCYATDSLYLPAKRLLACRSFLYRQLRGRR